MTNLGIMHTRRGARGFASLLAATVVSLAVLAFASSALALKPTGDFVNFGDCPVSNPVVISCLYAQTTSGEFKIGSTEVPIAKTITLQSGLAEVSEGNLRLVGATDGNTLSKTPQTVPGGLLKILAPSFFGEPLTKIFNEFINKGITGVTASTELVGEPHLFPFNVLFGSGTGLSLPVRVHLENEFLGPKCYVGSKAKPVNVELTTGTTSPPLPNKPIKGSSGELEVKDEGALFIDKKNSLVNNSFGAPTSEGCGSQILFGLFTGIIDSAVNAEVGLPSEPGNNTAILNGNQEIGGVAAVIASEK
ncbi:MAG TPA: hypothetical protein VGI26_06470 [Solirubrobacteraceae bacterium]